MPSPKTKKSELQDQHTALQARIAELEKSEQELLAVKLALMKSEERLDLAFQATQDGIWDINRETGIHYHSDRMFTMLGYTRADTDNPVKFFNNLVHPDDKPLFEQKIKQYLSGLGKYYQDVVRMRAKSGEYRIILSRATGVLRDLENKPLRIVGTHSDITDRMHAELKLAISEKNLQEAQKLAHLGSWDLDLKTNKAKWSDEFFRICGFEPGAFEPDLDSSFKIIHPDDLHNAQKLLDDAVKNRNRYYNETRIIRPDGEIRYVIAHGLVEYDKDDTPARIYGSFLDITDRKKAELELLREKQYKENIVESVPSGLIVISNSLIRSINNSFLEMFGCQKANLIGRSLDQCFHEMGCTININEVFSSWRDFEKIEVCCNPPNREPLHVRISINEMKLDIRDDRGLEYTNNSEIGRESEYLLMIEDITDRVKAEQLKHDLDVKMLATSKMVTLGQMATGMAHEMNQPLTYISSMIQKLEMDLTRSKLDPNSLLEKIQTANQQITRLTGIIDHLRVFGRRTPQESIMFNLVTVLDNSMLLMSEQLNMRNIEIIREIPSDLAMIKCNPNQLEQVFINLFQNSIDALEAKKNKAKIRIKIVDSINSDELIFKFSDNGTGMSKVVLDKIFEPFFTTKEVGRGTGLGLSIVYGIIQAHAGEITCRSFPNKGTTFTIKFPKQIK